MNWVVVMLCKEGYEVVTDRHEIDRLEGPGAYRIWITPNVPMEVRKLCEFRVAPRGGDIVVLEHNEIKF